MHRREVKGVVALYVGGSGERTGFGLVGGTDVQKLKAQ